MPRDGVEVEGVVAHRCLDKRAAAGADSDGKQSKRAFARDANETGAEKNARGEVDYFAGAEAHEDLFKADIAASGQNFAEALAAAVGIPVGFAESATGGFHGFRRRAERIFVGSQFNGVDFEILLDFFDRFAGNVGREALNVIRDELLERVGHENILCRA